MSKRRKGVRFNQGDYVTHHASEVGFKSAQRDPVTLRAVCVTLTGHVFSLCLKVTLSWRGQVKICQLFLQRTRCICKETTSITCIRLKSHTGHGCRKSCCSLATGLCRSYPRVDEIIWIRGETSLRTFSESSSYWTTLLGLNGLVYLDRQLQ